MVDEADVSSLDADDQTELWKSLFCLSDMSIFDSMAPRFAMRTDNEPPPKIIDHDL